jgi:ubiquinone/menaquinone biosynthesis C-methylase UbiE
VDSAAVREVFDRSAATYDIAAFPFFTPFGEALVEFAQIQPHERVLDVGCGAGAALAPASERAASAVGVELSPAMAERARAAAPTAEVRVGDASALEFDDGSFDVVLSSFTVFFMPDPTAALTDWRRVLAPGGRVVLSTWAPNDPRWGFERDIRRGYISELDPEFLRELRADLDLLERFDDARKVAAELGAAGFAEIESTEHEREFFFRDEQAWWEWQWSHAARGVLERLPEESQQRLRAEVGEAMQHLRTDEGFPRTYTAVYTRAQPGE